MNNVVILSGGYISTKIVEKWSIDYRVIQIRKSDIDYTTAAGVEEIVEKYNPVIVVNCYGYTGKPNVDACENEVDLCYGMNIVHNVDIVNNFNTCGVHVITVSSGCIYNDESGNRLFSENDTPNFGYTNPSASTYSKSKSLFEELTKTVSPHNYVLRIRMPFDEYLTDSKNYVGKILKYNKLVSYKNSLTDINLLVEFIEYIVTSNVEYGVYNVVNTNGITAAEVLEIAAEYNYINRIERCYSGDDLLSEGVMKCRRSNCVLSNDKIKNYIDVPTSEEAVRNAFIYNRGE